MFAVQDFHRDGESPYENIDNHNFVAVELANKQYGRRNLCVRSYSAKLLTQKSWAVIYNKIIWLPIISKDINRYANMDGRSYGPEFPLKKLFPPRPLAKALSNRSFKI